jgi:hypothetical protein
MKRCPQCQRVYTDESLRFCLDDGIPLTAADRTDPIQPSPTSRRDDPQTEVLPAPLFNPPPAKPSSPPGYVYVMGTLLVVCIFLLFAGVGVFAWLKLRGTETPPVANKRSDETKERGTSTTPTTPTPTPTPSVSPSLNALARQLLGTWSWNTYAKSFSADGTGIYYDEGKKCFNFKYEVNGDVLRMTVDGEQKCGSGGGSYRISITGDTMRHEYIENGYVTTWTRKP